MNPNFLCKCGHREKMHTSLEDALKYRNHIGRFCVELKNYPEPTPGGFICKCNNFEVDNLKYLANRHIEEKIEELRSALR